MKIYTKFGDQGQTALFDGRKVSKDHLRIETYGTLDETNSHLGLAAAECRDVGIKAILEQLQRGLFDLGTDLATPHGSPNEGKICRISERDVQTLEQLIDEATAEISPLKRFILPGGGVTAGRLHVARSVARRAERRLVTLMQEEEIGPNPLIYLNRLSDLLFTLARLANKREGIPDVEWESKKSP